MAAETIKEFLVSLGFKTDEAAMKKFERGIDTVTTAVERLGVVVEAIIVGRIGMAFMRLTANLEQLYFASVRTGSAAVNLKALDIAAQNFGAGAGEAIAAVEGLAHALRINPGNEGILNALLTGAGMQGTRDAKGNLRDMTDILTDLAKVFQNQPIQMAEQFANMFGIPEKVLLAMRNGDFAGEVSKMRREFNSADWQTVTKHAHEFEVQMRDLGTYLESFGMIVIDALQKKLGMSVKDINHWIQSHGKEISDWIVKGATIIGTAAVDIVKAINGITTAYEGLLKMATKLGEFLVAHSPQKLIDTLGDSINETLHALGLISDEKYNEGRAYYDREYGSPAAAGGAPTGNHQTAAAGLFDSFLNWLFPPDKTSRFQLSKSFSDAQVAGIMANLQTESGFDPHRVGDSGRAYGIAQWHQAGQDRFKQWAGIDIRDSTLSQQLGFLIHDMMSQPGFMRSFNAAQNNPELAGRLFSLGYEQPLDKEGEAKRRGALAVNLYQQTHINVHSTGDPKATAAAVAAEQGRVNSELQRNLQAATR